MGKKLIAGANDLTSWCIQNGREILLAEWDTEENILSPSEVARSSSKHKIAWKCVKCGYQWKLTPNARIKVSSDGSIKISECPMCLKEKQTSFPEQAIYYYVTQGFEDTVNGNTSIIGMELDIFVPSLKTAIEYDGYAWHQDTKKDFRKNELCKQNGVKIIRVREIGCPSMVNDNYCKVISIQPNSRENLSSVLLDLCDILGFSADINLHRDEPLIMALYQKRKYDNSIAYLYPELAKEFHPTKNGTLTAEDINKKSARKVWWKCSVCGYDWPAAVSSRTNGHGCPACSGRVLVPGKNDLETWCKQTGNEHLLAEWDYEANVQSPKDTTKKSSYRASWKCKKCGEPYTARVYNRTNGCGCPVCAGKKVKSGLNDFKTWCIQNGREAILAEWDPVNELTPEQVSHGSGKGFQWICSVCSHHWPATLDNRKKGKGCPECGKVKRAQSNRLRSIKKKKSDK